MENIELAAQNTYEETIQLAWDNFYEDKLDDAERICNKLILDHPNKSGNHYLLGHILKERCKYQQSADEFLLSIKNDTIGGLKGYAYYWLGIIYGKRSWSKDDSILYIYDESKSENYHQLARESDHLPPNALFHFQYRLKGQERVKLFEQGISLFPDMTEFYILLSHYYRAEGMRNMQFAALNRALEKDITSCSLQFNLGEYYYSQGDFVHAAGCFSKALEQSSDPNSNFAINYMQGRIAERTGNNLAAEKFYLDVFNQRQGQQDCLFGLFGLITIYIDTAQPDKLDELILNLDINIHLLNEYGRVTGGPIDLLDNVTDTIQIENFLEIYQKLTKLKLNPKQGFLNGKIWLLRFFLARQLNKNLEQYKAIKNVLKYKDKFDHNLLVELHGQALETILYNKTNNSVNKSKFYEYLITDFTENDQLSDRLIFSIEHILKLFFDERQYEKVVTLSEFFTKEQLAENDGLFMTAYSYVETNHKDKGEQLYQYFLLQHGDSAAVLNNLGLLLSQKGDYSGAVTLYKRGLEIDNKDTHLTSNLQNTLKKIEIEDKKVAKERVLKQEYMSAIQAIKGENDFVLTKLALFIERAKNDPSFDNWKLPVPKFNFQKYLAVNKQIADSLLSQWLKKQYLVDTKERDNYNVVIYAINPYLESEIQRVEKLKIPVEWVNGFINISVDVLENKGYFTIMERIEKVNKKFRSIFERDVNELFHNYLLGHQKTTIVLSGSLVELALIYFCEKTKIKTVPVQEGSKTKNKQLYSCVLNELISYVEQTKAFGQDFTHLSNLSRIYRNFIHPGKELRDGVDSSKADLCFISTIEILKKIL